MSHSSLMYRLPNKESERQEHTVLRDPRQQKNLIWKTRLLYAIVVPTVVLLQAFVLESVGVCAAPAAVQARRMFVPGLHPERWPQGDWVPVSPQNLEALMTSASVLSRSPDRFSFSSALYEATFNPQTAQLEQGVATLVRTRGEAGVTLFEPCNLALSGVRWRDNDSAEPVVLGTGLDGVKRLVASQSARELGFNWTSGGRKRLTGYDFDIEVPKSVVTSFRLSAPAGWEMTSDTGVVDRASDSPGSLRLSVWRVELGHSHRCRIRVQEPVASDSKPRDTVSYRLNSRLQLRSENVEQVFEYTFDRLSPDRDELTVAIHPDLIVSSIEDDLGRAYSWRDTGAQSDKWHALRIQLTGTDGEDESRVVILGRQSVPPPGSGNVQVRIEPPRPADAVLLGGNASPVNIVVESPYQLATYSTGGLRQTATSVDEDRHELAFEQYTSRAYVDLQIQNSGRQSSRKLSVREYSLLNVGTTPQEVDVLLELTSQTRGVFTSTWIVPSEWEVTAVELVTQSGTVDAASKQLSWSVTRDSGQHQRLVIDLADGLPVRKPLRLRVGGLRADRSRESDFHVPVILPETARSVSVAFGVVGCDDPNELQIVSDDYQRHADAALFAETAWSELISVLGEVPQTVWTAGYSTQSDAIRSAALHLPGDELDSVAAPPINLNAAKSETKGPQDGSNAKRDGGASPSGSDLSPDTAVSPDSETQVDVQKLAHRAIVSAELDSRLSLGSVSRDFHRFTWRFHYSADSSPFRFRLPAASELLAVTWQGQKVAPVQEEHEWFIPLTFVNAGDELSVEYTSPSQDVYLRETYRCRIPTTDVTVVQFDWRVRLHDRYSVVSFASELTRGEELQSGSWLSWCFGPLARRDSSKVFSPVGEESWKRFLRGRLSDLKEHTPSAKVDWQTFSASAAGLPDSLAVHVCDHSRLHALSWFVLTLSLLVGVLLRTVAASHRSRFALIWLSGCVASVVLVPGAYAELVGAAALGSILATLVPRSFVRPVRMKAPEAVQVSMASTITRRIVTGSLILAAMCLAGSAVAQQIQLEQDSVIDVLVPYVDSPFQTEVDPEYVYIRKSDHQRLYRTSIVNKDETTKLLLTESLWTVNVTESGRAEIVASIKVALHDDDADEVEIPIPARFLTGQAECSVNGLPVSVLPSADGSRLRVPLPDVLDEATKGEPGSVPVPPPVPESVDAWREYRIELRLRPLTQRSPELSRISLPIPAILNSHVALAFQRSPAAVVVGSSSEVTPLTSQGTADFVLGPEDELTISWQRVVDGISSTTPVLSEQPTVELRSSIDVHPNWMERRTHARYFVEGREVRQIEWTLPELCQVDLNQFRARNMVDKALRREAGQMILTCEFDPPLTESFDFDFRWRQMLPETEDVPEIVWAVPNVPGQADSALTVTSHLVGLTPEAGFQFSSDLQGLASASDVGGDEFIGSWPENARPRIPLMAINVADGAVLNPGIAPAQSQRTTRVSQIARIQSSEIRWTFSAEVDTAVVPAFTHEFLLDEVFRVDTVTVLEDDVDRLSHWDHENGKLTLHLRDRRSGVQNITITGHQRLKGKKAVNVPRIKPVVGESAESTLLIYRSRQLQVAVEGSEAIIDDSVATSTESDSDEFVGRFRMSPQRDARISVEHLPSIPSVWTVADVTSDEVGECYVSATIHLHNMARRNLQVELPAWAAMGDLVVIPTISGAGAVVVTNDQKSIDVRLPLPIPQRVEVTLTARFSHPAGASFRLSPPIVSGVEVERSVITLSQGMDEWDVLPNEAPSASLLSGVSEYEPRLASETDEFAIWTAATRVSRVALSSDRERLPPLVLHSIRPGVRRSGVAKTNFLLQTDSSQVSLDWPDNIRLISVQIDGRVESILPPVNGILRIPLGMPGSVHDVELLWSVQRDAAAMKIQRRAMPIPQLIDAGVVQSFVLATPTRRISLISTANSQQQGSSAAAQLSDKWLKLLQRRSSNSSRLESALTIAESLKLAVGDSSEKAERSSISDTAVDLLLSTQGDSESNRFGRALVESVDGTEVEFWVFDTQVDRILGSVLIVIVAFPFFILLLRLETGDRIAKRPELCWLVIGLIWWLCLRGSGAGFILGVVSCLWIAASYLFRRRVETAVIGNS
jgi:hypothetical protein